LDSNAHDFPENHAPPARGDSVPIQFRTNVIRQKSMLIDQIKSYLVETAGTDPQVFENPYLKVTDLKLDSLGLVEMLFEIEDKYGFQIPDPMVFLPMTFAEMVAAIESMVQEQTQAKTSTT
jgi:acyl carrier protein